MYEFTKTFLINVSLIITNYFHLQSLNSKAKPVRVKTKRHKHPTGTYSNSTATFNIILRGDIYVYPGLGSNSPKCSAWEKTVKYNEKRFICGKCFDVTHGKCSNSETLVLNSRVPCYWNCNKYLHTVLPFFNSSSLENGICNLDTPLLNLKIQST